MYEVEYVDQTPLEDEIEYVKVVVSKERYYQQELLQIYNQKEIEYKQLREQQKQIIDNIQQIKQKKYKKDIVMVDLYTYCNIQENLKNNNYMIQTLKKQDIKADKQSKIDQLKQIQQAKNQLKLLFTQTEINQSYV